MKTKLKLFLFVLSISFFSSCTDNSTPIDVSSDDLLGIWNITDFNFEGTTSATLAGQTITSTFVNTGRDYDFTVEFTSNPNTIASSGSYVSISTVTVAGQTFTEEVPVNSISGLDSGTWSLNGNVITTTVGGESSEMVIDQITSNLLVLKAVVEENQSAQGADITILGNLTLTLEK